MVVVIEFSVMRCQPLRRALSFRGVNVDRFNFLNIFLDTMESRGEIASLVYIHVDDDFIEQYNNKYKSKYTLSEFEKVVDVCKAHEWVKCTAGGRGSYGNLVITQKGLSAVKSKNESNRRKAERTIFKKFSDFVEDHKGLFIVFGFILALLTFVLKIYGDQS
ncbi:hypothetical protein F1K75_18200 [Vibrio cholerae]|nr:hypothetical protein [Vibrio cholerae]